VDTALLFDVATIVIDEDDVDKGEGNTTLLLLFDNAKASH
jgi:hypothetical protein